MFFHIVIPAQLNGLQHTLRETLRYPCNGLASSQGGHLQGSDGWRGGVEYKFHFATLILSESLPIVAFSHFQGHFKIPLPIPFPNEKHGQIPVRILLF